MIRLRERVGWLEPLLVVRLIISDVTGAEGLRGAFDGLAWRSLLQDWANIQLEKALVDDLWSLGSGLVTENEYQIDPLENKLRERDIEYRVSLGRGYDELVIWYPEKVW